METLIPAFLRRQRNQHHLTLENLSAKVGMLPQHLSEIESGKRDPRLSSIERITDALAKKMVRKVKNRWDDEIWPWERASLR
jgi:transcriptional regulator with XRE-family HTH domain